MTLPVDDKMGALLGPLPGLPRRHGADVCKARRMAQPLHAIIQHHRPEPTVPQWQALAQALTRGDPLADQLADWMREQGLRTTQPLLERALNLGLDGEPEAPPVLHAFFSAVETIPEWVDPPLLLEGARVCHLSGTTGMQVLRDVALMAGYQASALNRTLILTDALAQGAPRRVAETTRWWVDCTAPGGMSRFAPGFKTTVRARLMHALVRQRLRTSPEWNESELGLPINQVDMQATYLGFSVVFLLAQRTMGIPLTRDEAHAVMHLWRYIAWLMGVEEGMLFATEREGRIGLYQNLLSQAPPDASSIALGRALWNEPLHRPYGHALPWLNEWHGRMERARHLSICRLFLSTESMRDLGLPSTVLPWYPALKIPANLMRHQLLRLLPGGRQALMLRGRCEQEAYLAALLGQLPAETARLPQPHA